MSKILTCTYRACYTDINADGQVAPADFARYIVDTAYSWGENLGLGEKASEELGLDWGLKHPDSGELHPLPGSLLSALRNSEVD